MEETKKETVSFIQWMNPVLEALHTLGYSGKPKEVESIIIKKSEVSEDYLNETLKSGTSKFSNEVAWARQYLVWEGLIDNSKRGTWSLTKKGINTIHLTDEQILGIYNKWVAKNQESIKRQKDINTFDSRFLDKLKGISPKGFENICLQLLREWGFEDIKDTQYSRDGGIDGFGTLRINEFGNVILKTIFQCKRYDKGLVTIDQVRSFIGVMALNDFPYGVFITTNKFTKDTEKEVANNNRIMLDLIDGERLVDMFKKVELGMIEVEDDKINNVDKLYQIDEEYFNKFE